MSQVADSWAREVLAALESRALRRTLEPLDSPQGPHITVGGQRLLNFSSNDYLGLAADADVIAAGREALATWGAGSGASRLVVGDSGAHQSLEAALARFEGAEAALLFNSGYAANMGAVGALMEAGDVVFSDALNHASVIDGCRLSRARTVVFPHRDVEQLDALLRAHPGRRRLVVTESVFSMDGDRAPLKALAEVCARHGAALLVDEAHATGVFGARGSGLCEAEGVSPDLKVGTLSKALGGVGGFVACSAALREVLLNRARALVFSTSLPPAWCAMMETALRKAGEPDRRARLHARMQQLADALGRPADSPIFPVVLGSAEAALGAATRLRAAGLLVKAIRPPTVAEGTSRLRIALSAAHTAHDLQRLIDALCAGEALRPTEERQPRHEHR